MRGSLSHARLLTAALVVAVTAAVGASSALATSSTASANGVSVTASLSPDTVAAGVRVTQDVQVKNISDVAENLSIRILGPLPASAPVTLFVTLKAGQTFERSSSFSSSLLSTGKHSLTVIAANRATGQGAQATASITRT